MVRTRIDNYSEKNFFGTTRRERVGHESALRSSKTQPVTVVVKDQLPVSARKEIRITPLETSGAGYDSETGIVTWNLELPPTETQRLKLAYEVN